MGQAAYSCNGIGSYSEEEMKYITRNVTGVKEAKKEEVKVTDFKTIRIVSNIINILCLMINNEEYKLVIYYLLLYSLSVWFGILYERGLK